VSGDPYPKGRQLQRGEKRYRRKVASGKQWQAIQASKMGPCRCCGDRDLIQMHHVVSRAQGGDDVADNIVPVCWDCHARITRRDTLTCHTLVLSLSDAEYAYAIDKRGEGFFEQAYGITYQRGGAT
jgi:5-methylcytosine-specific restriction endonuclease McrA